MKKRTKEEKIVYYSYYYNSSENFVEEYLNNFEEMDVILHKIAKELKELKKDYIVRSGDGTIMIENKKTKESYKLSIEF